MSSTTDFTLLDSDSYDTMIDKCHNEINSHVVKCAAGPHTIAFIPASSIVKLTNTLVTHDNMLKLLSKCPWYHNFPERRWSDYIKIKLCPQPKLVIATFACKGLEIRFLFELVNSIWPGMDLPVGYANIKKAGPTYKGDWMAGVNAFIEKQDIVCAPVFTWGILGGHVPAISALPITWVGSPGDGEQGWGVKFHPDHLKMNEDAEPGASASDTYRMEVTELEKIMELDMAAWSKVVLSFTSGFSNFLIYHTLW